MISKTSHYWKIEIFVSGGVKNLKSKCAKKVKNSVKKRLFFTLIWIRESCFLLYRFREIYLNSYLIGEGMSGFLPALVALAQGVGGNPYCDSVAKYNETTGDTDYVTEAVYPEPRYVVLLFHTPRIGSRSKSRQKKFKLVPPICTPS